MNCTKKQLLIFIFWLLSVLSSSCNLLQPSLETTWHVTKIEYANGDTESESIYANAFLSFYDNGLASFMNKNEHDKSLGNPIYRIGEWSVEGKNLRMVLRRTMINVTFTIRELTQKWLVIEIIQGPKETIGTILKCQKSNLYRNNAFDLLHPATNNWRVRADRKEDRVELKARVVSHVNFLLGYFKMVEEKSQGYFETSILQTPFQFYSNGIGLPHEFYSSDIWLSNFYDEEDAAISGQMLAQGLTSIDVYPGDDKSYTKGYYNALLLIKEYIEK